MLYYILFWTLLGFIIHFYIIFRTNLLTGGPTQNCCFLPILGFRRKRISNGVQTEWNLQERDFQNKHDPEDLDPTSRHQLGRHEVGGAPTPQARPPHSWGPTCPTATCCQTTQPYVCSSLLPHLLASLSNRLIRLQRIYNFWLLHAILSTVLDIIGLYYPLLYYFSD